MEANKNSTTLLLKTARGQLDGILKMVEEGRYCIDISNQILSTQALLNKTNKEILSAHLKHCVKNSMGSPDSEAKTEELIVLIEKLIK